VAQGIHEILDELYASATDEQDKGSKFERLMQAYLQADLLWADRFSDVWLWMEWPDRHGKPDTGIDLVAVERDGSGLTAIQCKFYAPNHYLQKSDIDSFFTASGKSGFSQRVIISTTDKWSKHAEDALADQQIPVQRLRVQDLDESSVDWSQFTLSTPDVIQLKERKALRGHQITALDKVREGLSVADRGKLIMACGTGKTFTSLKIAEDLVGAGGSVLFLVPSISLLAQTLREWTIEADVRLRPHAVCSDPKASAKTKTEDISIHDLAYPASTDPAQLVTRIGKANPDEPGMTVVFSTYQSLGAVADAQALGLAEFDLIICDEAHRTTGATLAGEDESAFVKVHDQTFIKGRKRLYMTATPRIYDDTSKAKAGQANAVLASMDNTALYGEELHRLGFGEAVSKGLLTDYKVLVLAVDEKAISTTFQAQLADSNSELTLDDAAKIVGCWNGLAKRGVTDAGFATDPEPMGRAVAFARSIKDSQRFASLFTELVAQYADNHEDEDVLRAEAEHVDGTFNVLRRNERLDWLKAPLDAGNARVLSNARCLSEGVDVPALDAVMFLNPRNSVVDVVQSVGRVMRKAPGKAFGYVILPIGIPSTKTPEEALADNEKFKVVWQVLQALRAHDERFNAMVNQIDLNSTTPDKIQVIGVGGFETDRDGSSTSTQAVQTAFSFPQLDDWRDAIYAKLVTKVGSRRYWEDWARDIARIAERHTTRIHALLDTPGLAIRSEFEKFLSGLRANLNEGISHGDAIDMLAQHLITQPVFSALFSDYAFAERNPVSQVMQRMLDVLDEHNLDDEQQILDAFYDSVRLRAEGIDNAAGKQRIITELYEQFFKIAFPRTAEQLGIVYTPVQVVDFILRSVQQVLIDEFGATLGDEGVHVLDPFTGTGTFLVRLLQSGLIPTEALAGKYASELHANEILLLAYYIAAINIEATFHDLTGADFTPFDGIVLTDTFQIAEDGDAMDLDVFPANNARVEAQKQLDIRVIVGNPPYSVGQSNQNDDAQNLKYPTLDARIGDTYAKLSTATNKNSLYDSYIRAIRWASTRIASSPDGGVVAFVTNNGYLDGNTADGLRKTLTDEFSTVYCYNLRGNQRTAGELSKQEGGKIFGSGSRNGVAVLLLVRNPQHTGPCRVKYADIGDYLDRDAKLQHIEAANLATLNWQDIAPNAAGDWINQRSLDFPGFHPIGTKDVDLQPSVFSLYSRGLATARDSWVYNSSRSSLEGTVRSMVDHYNGEVTRLEALRTTTSSSTAAANAVRDPQHFSWNRTDFANADKGRRYEVRPSSYRIGTYRPFMKQHVYFDRALNDMVYRLDRIFPEPDLPNVGIYVVGMGSAVPFSAWATDCLPDLHVTGSGSGGQFFPRWTYTPSDGALEFDSDTPGWHRQDNITDAALALYRKTYGDDIGRDDLFAFVYGLLHSPNYRTRYEADLKKALPRLPFLTQRADFDAFAEAGAELLELHLTYESAAPYDLDEVRTDLYEGEDLYRVAKLSFAKNGKAPDRSTLVYNSHLTLTGIPDAAYAYQLGSRSALEWIIDRWQDKTDKDSGIRNDANAWGAEHDNPRYIVDLIKRVTTVSVRTVEIVKSLPPLRVAGTSAPQT